MPKTGTLGDHQDLSFGWFLGDQGASCEHRYERYPRLYGSKKAIQQSIGYRGIANRDALRGNASRYSQIDITEAAGATHDIRSITRSRPLLEKISKSTFELLLR